MTPSEVLGGERVVLRRAIADHAELLAEAVRASLDHLRPWMVWATAENSAADVQRARLRGLRWAPDSDWDYVMHHPASDAVIGGCSLMRRLGVNTLEIGYWVHVDHCSRGVATDAARLLTEAGLSIAPTVVIRCDAGNLASAKVPERLGYRLASIDNEDLDSPAATGKVMRWLRSAGSPAA
jgi:RimJ/RimL family protein N-acetyltransferase